MITTSSAFASSIAATSFAPFINIINGNALMILGGGIAFTINKLAHHIFSVKEDSNASIAIKAVSFVAGAAACYFVAPHAAIFAITMNEAAWILVGVVVATGMSKQITGKKSPILAMPALMPALIPFVGLYGRVALITVGTAAAGVGAIW